MDARGCTGGRGGQWVSRWCCVDLVPQVLAGEMGRWLGDGRGPVRITEAVPGCLTIAVPLDTDALLVVSLDDFPSEPGRVRGPPHGDVLV